MPQHGLALQARISTGRAIDLRPSLACATPGVANRRFARCSTCFFFFLFFLLFLPVLRALPCGSPPGRCVAMESDTSSVCNGIEPMAEAPLVELRFSGAVDRAQRQHIATTVLAMCQEVDARPSSTLKRKRERVGWIRVFRGFVADNEGQDTGNGAEGAQDVPWCAVVARPAHRCCLLPRSPTDSYDPIPGSPLAPHESESAPVTPAADPR